MSGEQLRDLIRALITAHPAISASEAGHTGYIERYRTSDGLNIGLETRGEKAQNLFVETRTVRPRVCAAIDHHSYWERDYLTKRPNANLFHQKAFHEVDITRFIITDPWQAVLVIWEVAGPGGEW